MRANTFPGPLVTARCTVPGCAIPHGFSPNVRVASLLCLRATTSSIWLPAAAAARGCWLLYWQAFLRTPIRIADFALIYYIVLGMYLFVSMS